MQRKNSDNTVATNHKPSNFSTVFHFHTKSPSTLRILAACGVLGPILVVVAVLSSGVDWNLPTTKLLLLAGQYLIFLPIILWLLWQWRNTSDTTSPIAFYRIMTTVSVSLYVLILLPLAFVLGRGIYQGDESAYLFEARCLNAGRLYMAQPLLLPVATISYAHHLVWQGKWFGKYPGGWPLVLSLGALTRLEWLINPLLGGLLLWVVFHIGKQLLDTEAARAAVVILALSGFFVLNCLGFMSHVLCGLLLALATLCYSRYARSGKAMWIGGVLACLVASSFVRPFTAICAGTTLIGVWTLRWNWRAVLRFALWTGLFVLVVIGFSALQNFPLTGSYFISPYALYNGGSMREISFRSSDLLQGIFHDIPARLADTSAVSFPFVFLLALYGFWRGKRDRLYWALALPCCALVAGYVVETANSDSPIGERFYFEAYFAIALLAGAGWIQLTRYLRLDARFQRSIGIAGSIVSVAVIILCAHWEVDLRQPSRHLASAAAHPPFTSGIVFLIGTDLWPASNLNYNRPSSSVLYLLDPGPSERAIIAERAGERNWACLEYDEQAKAAEWRCPPFKGRN